jgi:hypothetical protein
MSFDTITWRNLIEYKGIPIKLCLGSHLFWQAQVAFIFCLDLLSWHGFVTPTEQS